MHSANVDGIAFGLCLAPPGRVGMFSLFILVLGLVPAMVTAQSESGHEHHHGSSMRMDSRGMVMHENSDQLPYGCERIAGDVEFTIHAGSRFAIDRPGTVFGMSQHDIRVPPCSRITINFANEDAVRHQWMVHGLPNYLYPMGMFHIEASGGQTVRGTFIVPAEDRTYLVHCDMAQHMEKGMRGQLVVGTGSGNLWGVPGVSDGFYRADYFPKGAPLFAVVAALTGFLVTLRFLGKTGVD